MWPPVSHLHYVLTSPRRKSHRLKPVLPGGVLRLALRYDRLVSLLVSGRTAGGTMKDENRRNFFAKMAALGAFLTGGTQLLAQQPASGGAPPQTSPKAAPANAEPPRHGSNHIHDGIYYFSGTGANDGYPKEDHVLVTDAFEKHVTRTMDALKRSVERAGCTMDSIIHLQVFLCLPLADGVPMPAGKARFEAHKAQYDALNKIYGTYFSPGKAPSRACMAVEWIPGDSLIEMVGSAAVVAPAS